MPVKNAKLRDLIDRLRSNSFDLIELDFRGAGGSLGSDILEGGSGGLFRELLKALRRNNTVLSVNLIMRFLSGLSDPEKFQLFEAIGSLPNLLRLRVASSGFSGMPLEVVTTALRQAKGLMNLRLHSIHFRGKVMREQTGSNSTDQEFLDFLTTLQNLPCLESFALDDIETTFDLNTVVATVSRLSKLKELYLKSSAYMNHPGLTMDSLRSLCHSSTLKSLTLTRLDLAPLIPASLREWESNTVLTTLSLECNNLGYECGMSVAHFLRQNSTLTNLNLGYNRIPDDCGLEIANALMVNTTLQHLDLTANELGHASGVAFAHVLETSNGENNHSCLEYLNLAQNQLGDQGCKVIAAALPTNTTLKALTLAESTISDAACVDIANALALNTNLIRLNLSDNKISDTGCQALARALESNTTLERLTLFGNKVGNIGVQALAGALQGGNSTLRQLNLAGNERIIGEKPYDALAAMLHENMTLEGLWVPPADDESKIKFYLKLNRVGRRDLLRNANQVRLWANAFSSCADDLNCLFYLLRANPAVCDVVF
jgi:hypothetical protein